MKDMELEDWISLAFIWIVGVALVLAMLVSCAHRPPAPVQPPNQYPGPGHRTVQRPTSNYAHPGSVEWIKERKREAGL